MEKKRYTPAEAYLFEVNAGSEVLYISTGKPVEEEFLGEL